MMLTCEAHSSRWGHVYLIIRVGRDPEVRILRMDVHHEEEDEEEGRAEAVGPRHRHPRPCHPSISGKNEQLLCVL